MTPPEKPKPLTDGELIDIEGILRTVEKIPNDNGEENDWTTIQFLRVLEELKRLRAGPVQAREKILRDALDRAKKDNIRVREFLREPRKDNLIACLLDEYEAILWAIKQADAVEDGPEVDMSQVKTDTKNRTISGINLIVPIKDGNTKFIDKETEEAY